MRSTVANVVAVFSLAVAGCAVALAADEQSAIVIVFKDGRQQTISMADVARIEFRTSASNSLVGRGRFLGKWKVGNGAGGHFFITLEPNGVATKTIGSSHGTWTIVNGEARVVWDDGWHDALRKVGDKYEKAAFSPGKTFSDAPSNVAEAENTSPQPN